MISIKKISICAMAFFCGTTFADKIHLSFDDLLRRVADLDALTVAPIDGEKSGNASSYDRASKYDEKTRKYVNWWANGDGNGRIKRNAKEHVVAEIKGPGVIWRTWSARAQEGKIKMFIDGEKTPRFVESFADIFDSKTGCFPYSNLSVTCARGQNLFVPIAFDKSIKIVLEGDWGMYYIFSYSQFPENYSLDSFKGVFSESEKKSLHALNEKLSLRKKILNLPANTKLFENSLNISANSSKEFDLAGSGQIVLVSAKLAKKYPDFAVAKILRQLTVSISFDGEKTPAIWAPLGDFFASGYGLNTYSTLPAGVLRDGNMYFKFRMPFSNGAKIEIKNQSNKDVGLKFDYAIEELKKSDADKLMRMHVKWHKNHFGKDGKKYSADRWPDWPILIADGGAGRFVGVCLDVWTPVIGTNATREKYCEFPLPEVRSDEVSQDMLNGIVKSWWWGEGDEKFFVDGEKFPSHFGTGSEDYFGYAWGNPDFFEAHNQAQPRNYRNFGHVTNVRFHIADNVPFMNSIEACIEKYHGDDYPLQYAATAFWYQVKNVADNYAPIESVEERTAYEKMPPLKSGVDKDEALIALGLKRDPKEPLEFEQMFPNEMSPQSSYSVQDMRTFGNSWSKNKQLFVNLGDRGFIEFEIPANGKNKIIFNGTSASDYLDIDVYVNGKFAASYKGLSGKVERIQNLNLGTFDAQDGGYVLRFVGKLNEGKGALAGFDSLIVSPEK